MSSGDSGLRCRTGGFLRPTWSRAPRHAESEFNPQPHREVLRVLECDPQCKTISAATSVPPPFVRDQSGFQDCEAPVITLHCQSMTARVTLDQAAVASLDQAAFRPGHRAWKAKFTS
ncbi:unnamed protein product [Durusdinium trenchii]|uniref:Uncharacterized protein n=1 Tax=Durusdinium trenchii TaxID=1381693 RepID=A0ABP0JTK7_9DINO